MDNTHILAVKTTPTGYSKQAIERLCHQLESCCIVFIPPNPPDEDTESSR